MCNLRNVFIIDSTKYRQNQENEAENKILQQPKESETIQQASLQEIVAGPTQITHNEINTEAENTESPINVQDPGQLFQMEAQRKQDAAEKELAKTYGTDCYFCQCICNL